MAYLIREESLDRDRFLFRQLDAYPIELVLRDGSIDLPDDLSIDLHDVLFVSSQLVFEGRFEYTALLVAGDVVADL